MLHADETPQTSVVGPFGGLNTNISREAVPSNQSPDLLNVDITPGGRTVKKRQGFGLDVSLTYSSSPAHNLYTFFDTAGNQVRLAFNDRNVSSSINGASWTLILTTGIATGSTWDCTDYLGQAYCVSSAFDCPIITNGTSAGTSCNTNIPAGTCVASTGDRLLVGGTSANPSRISYSQSTIFTNFTLGTQNSSASFEDVNAPGSKITHLAYHYGRWLWWKDQSFGFLIGTGQLDLNIVTVSNTIGTLDNTDVYDQGLTYFRGQDNQIYIYDGSNLTRTFSTDISPTLNTANRRKANSWQQTTQTDFSAGLSVPAVNISTTISPGDVIVSSFQAIENSSTQWTSGTATNISVGVSSLTLAINNLGNITNPDFESAFAGNWTGTGNAGEQLTKKASAAWPCGTLNPQSGSAFAESEGAATNNYSGTFQIIINGVPSLSVSFSASLNDCAWHQITLSPTAQYLGARVQFQIQQRSGVTPGISGFTSTSDTYIWGGPISLYYDTSSSGANQFLAVDNITLGSSTVTSGSFTSQVYDTSFTSSTFQIQSSYTALTSTPSFILQTSTSSLGTWANVLISTGSNAIGNRFARYVSSFTIGSGDYAQSSISNFTMISRSTGSYYSAVDNAAALTSWNQFNATDQSNSGTISYFTRASTNSFSILSATPSWSAQTKNATVAASTGSYMQMRADFAVTAATQSPTLNDFQFNWFEGAAADKMYATYFNNAIWFSLSLGTSTSTNNRVFKYDLLSQAWTPYDIAANGFLIYNNFLYFAGASTGCVFQFGNNVTSDNGSAINAYWKSKDFFGATPFQDEDLRTLSWYVKSSSGTTLAVTYQVNESTQTSFNINLFDPRASIIRYNRNFLAGSMYNVINWKFGDNSTNPGWEVFAGQWTYVPRGWSVYP